MVESASAPAIAATFERVNGGRVGLVIFGGSARVRLPLTTDVQAAIQVVSTLESGTVLVGAGTSASAGIAEALEALTSSGSDPSEALVLLISDGEDLGDPAAAGAAATALRAAGVDVPKLARDVVTIFFTQVFRDGFFHADMHPGNIQVSVAPETFGRYIALDFGIVGTLTEVDKEYLAQNFIAFFRRDYKRVAELHVESGWVPPSTRVEELEGAIRAVCEPHFDRPLKDISLGNVLLRLFQTSRRFNVEIQPQLVLLQKTLLNIEGLGRQLDPDLDLWVTAKPFLERWMEDQVGLPALRRRFLAEAPYLAAALPELPRLLHLRLSAPPSASDQVMKELAAAQRVRNRLLAVTAVLLAAVLVAVLWR